MITKYESRKKTKITQNGVDELRSTSYPTEMYGLSRDDKPTDAKNGDLFLEMDTCKLFVFDETNTRWRELS